jgi:hypothetical protein
VLLLACLLATLPFASATATVSFGTCAVNSARACVNTTVTFSGTDLADVASVRISLSAANAELITCGNVTASATAVTCSLAVAASVNDGVYPVTLVLSGGATVDAGSLAVGTFLEASGVAGWTNTSGSSAYRVTGQSSSWPSTGDVWSVRGTFNTASTYSIVFYNSQPAAVAGSPGTPTCSPVTVTATTLSCTITSANGVMGMYNFLVKDTTNNALLLGSSSLYKIAVNPPLPEVTGASGSCATSSAACVSGASLTITGTNFNYRSAAYQKFFVGVTSAQRSAIQLTPTAAAKSGVTATLSVADGTPAGTYPVYVKLQVCMMGMMSPLYYVGNLVIGSRSDAAGFEVSNAAAIGTTVVSGFCYDGDDLCRNTVVTLTGTQLAGVTSVRVGSTAAEQALLPCALAGTPTPRTVACTLAPEASISGGVYPVTLVLSGGATVDAGSLAVGTFLEASGVAGWTNTSGSSAYRVTGQSSSWPSTGDVWSVRGTFNTASTYSIVFYNSQPAAVAGSPGTPTCSPVTVTATTLSCTITSANGVMGMYNFLVKDTTNNALLLGSSSLYKIAVNPPLPEVTGASGSCATSSAACVSGASLTITGTNFNYRSAAYQKFFVGVTSAQRSAIQLTPTAAAKSGVTATLSIEGNVAAGSYPIFVKLQVCMMGMMSPLRYVGNLVLHEGSVAGFNVDFPEGVVDRLGSCETWWRVPAYKASVAFAVIFAVLFLALLITLIVICCRFSLVRKGQMMRENFYEGPPMEMAPGTVTRNHYNVSAPPEYDNDRF